MLIKQLRKCGNSLGVIIPKSIREALGWEEDANLEYHIDGDKSRLTLVPTGKKQQQLDLLSNGKPTA